MTTALSSTAGALLAAASLALLPAPCRAGLFTVTLNTSGLPAGTTYALDFTLAAGGPNTNNTATITPVTFGAGGSAGPGSSVQRTGHVTGDLQHLPITLFEDVGGFGDFVQDFTPGSQLQFTVNLTTNPQPPGFGQDSFTFGVLYLDPGSGNFFNIITNDPNLNDAFAEIDLNASGPPNARGFKSTDPLFPNVPTATVLAVNVPEPSTLALFLVGASVAALAHRWPRRRAPGVSSRRTVCPVQGR
jgi:hypothetical protein